MKRALVLAVLSCCTKAPPEPTPDPIEQDTPAPTLTTTAAPAAAPSATCSGSAQPASVPVSPGDPAHGKFDLGDAVAGMRGSGNQLVARIETSQGTITCDLLADKAPITVANFVGLARGVRPWKDPKSGRWVRRPAYDGTTFHRIIRGFMIQGGDPSGNGTGEPGYVIPDEDWPCAHHDHVGELCMANRGPNTNGAQFFITDAAASHLDGGYTIFGECGPEPLVHQIAAVPTGPGDKPLTPVTIRHVTITRGAPAPAVPYAGARDP